MYVVIINGKKHGPYNADQIQSFKQEGKLERFKAKVYKVRQEVPVALAEPVLQRPAIDTIAVQHRGSQVMTGAASKNYNPNKVLAWIGIAFSCLWFASSLAVVTAASILGAAQFVAVSIVPLLGCVVWLDSIQVARVEEAH
jgi:hypothetical protein